MGKVQLGAAIYCRDGEPAGEVDRIVIDPKTGQVTHLVARAKELLLRDVVLPIEVVRSVDADGVRLAGDVLDLEEMPEYAEENFVSPGAEEVPAGTYRAGEVLFELAHVRHARESGLPLGKEVECRDGACGTIDEVLLDPVSGKVLSFRLRRGGALSRDVVVPAEWVFQTTGQRVRLDCNVRQLEEELRPAQALENEAA